MKQGLILIFICITMCCATIKKTSHSIKGVWIVIRWEVDGQELPSSALENAKIIFTDTSYTRVDKSGIGKGMIKYGNNKMDIYEKEGVLAGKHNRAIYKLENEQLTICYDLEESTGDNYPTKYETKSKPTLRLLVLKKEQTK